MGTGTPLGNFQAWGSAPISYNHHTFIFTIFLSSILLVISWSSRIKFLVWSSIEFFFMFPLCNRVRVLSIIKISVESRALLCCYDLEKIERTKEFILILWIVITSHIESMRHKNCWELMNVTLVIVAINRKW